MLYADVISLYVTRKYQQTQIIDENGKYWQRKSSYLLKDIRNFDEIFRKDVIYENI